MKKCIVYIFCFIIAVSSFSGCDSLKKYENSEDIIPTEEVLFDEESPVDNAETEQNEVCKHDYKLIKSTADCENSGTATYQCTMCGTSYDTYARSLGHTTESGSCERCGKLFSNFEIDFYIDEFKNPTDDAIIKNSELFLGTFSNSVTTNSELRAQMILDKDGVNIRLLEYGSQLVKAYSNTNYNLIFLDDEEEKYVTTGIMYENSDRIHLKDWLLVRLLKSNEKVGVYIVENPKYGGYATNYLFSIDTAGFNDIYREYYYKYMVAD